MKNSYIAFRIKILCRSHLPRKFKYSGANVTYKIWGSVNLELYVLFHYRKMVRNYHRKSNRASQYTKETLDNAVEEIKRGVLTLYRAHRTYHIPKTTLYYHVTGIRGAKSQSQGRPPVIPAEHESRLASALKTMERWGFGITRQELFQIVAEFVTINKVKTPFRNNIPGDDWFIYFKKRHNLSIKKPQSVEYARKKNHRSLRH